jgi:hypothetical protein
VPKERGVILGRRRVPLSVEERILTLRKKALGILTIARELGIGTSVVQGVVMNKA